MKKDFEVTTLKVGEGLRGPGVHVRPERLFVFPQGSVEDQPSYCWEMVDEAGRRYYAQISHKMLVEGLRAAAIFFEPKVEDSAFLADMFGTTAHVIEVILGIDYKLAQEYKKETGVANFDYLISRLEAYGLKRKDSDETPRP